MTENVVVLDSIKAFLILPTSLNEGNPIHFCVKKERGTKIL